MKRFFSYLMSVAILLLPLTANAEANEKWTENQLIAHAFGEIGGKHYTNSYEAFVVNYEKGQRIFEVDLQLTSDGALIGRHDWRAVVTNMLGQKLEPEKLDKPLSLEEVKSLKINEKYTAVDMNDIITLLKNYPDAYIVTDTKDLDEETVTKQFNVIVSAASSNPELLNRVIPQIYNQTMYSIIEKIHQFDSYIYTLYQSEDTDDEVVDFVKENKKIDAVTMPPHRATQEFNAKLKAVDTVTYIHTINNIEYFKHYQSLGVHGTYTDNITKQGIIEYEKDLLLLSLQKLDSKDSDQNGKQ